MLVASCHDRVKVGHFVLCEQAQFLQHTQIRVAISRERRERSGDNSHGVHALPMVPCIVEGPTGCLSELFQLYYSYVCKYASILTLIHTQHD